MPDNEKEKLASAISDKIEKESEVLIENEFVKRKVHMLEEQIRHEKNAKEEYKSKAEKLQKTVKYLKKIKPKK